MDIDTLIERQEVLVENQKQLLSAMVSTLDLMKAEKLRQEIDQEIAFDEPNKTVEQEEDPRVQKHKIIALKNGYTPEDVEEVASIYRSYYESLDEIEADLAAEGKPSNGSDYELRAENVRAIRDQDLSYIDHKYEEQRKQKSRPTQHPLKRPKKTMSKILLDRHTLELSNEELEEINLYLLNQREHAIALYSQQLYGMKRTANRLSNTSTSFQDQLQHMN